MSRDFRSFLRRVTTDQPAETPPPGFVPPPAPPANWHSVRDDLEQTVENLRELRSALLRYQQLIEQIDRARATDNVSGTDVVPDPATPRTIVGPATPGTAVGPDAPGTAVGPAAQDTARAPGGPAPQGGPPPAGDAAGDHPGGAAGERPGGLQG